MDGDGSSKMGQKAKYGCLELFSAFQKTANKRKQEKKSAIIYRERKLFERASFGFRGQWQYLVFVAIKVLSWSLSWSQNSQVSCLSLPRIGIPCVLCTVPSQSGFFHPFLCLPRKIKQSPVCSLSCSVPLEVIL